MRKIAILGYGTVGSGVVAVLNEGAHFLEQRIHDQVEVKYVLDLRDFYGDPIQDKIVHDYQVILNDPEIEVVVEVMGGLEPAYTFVSSAIEKGKSIVTSNKQLVEAKGAILGQMAREHHVSFLYEASVAGGIPIIRTVNNALWHEEIRRICGILNGTTNYILGQMESRGISFDEALAEAQSLGYAERNPEADVEGYDAARKIAILAGLVCDHHVPFESIPTRGIRQVTTRDVASARQLGGTIKLIAGFEFGDEKRTRMYAFVEPMFIASDLPLYNVNNVFNAVLIHSKMLDDTMYYGRGAGKHATASAVVSDIMASLTGVSQKEMIMWDEQIFPIHNIADEPNQYLVVADDIAPYITEKMAGPEVTALQERFTAAGKNCHLYRVLQPSTLIPD